MFTSIKEGWKSIPSHGDYIISVKGQIVNTILNKAIMPDTNNIVRIDGQEFTVHALMGCTFLSNDISNPYRNRVLFKDGDTSNLSLDNLYIEDTSDLPGEIWAKFNEANGRPVKNFYRVSNKGRVKSVQHDAYPSSYLGKGKRPCPETILSQVVGDRGYKTVWLSAETKPDIVAQVHRLVASCFCYNDDPEHKTQVNHKDGNPSNNDWGNLEWCTPSENAQHAIRTGLRGDWNGRKLRYQVKRLETGEVYASLSDVDKILGRAKGYCSDHLDSGRPITDVDGNIWTLEVNEYVDQKVHTEGQHCTIDEFPGKEFISLSEASLAIGRWEGYISDALKRGGVIKNKAGQVMHIHLIGDAPVVAANEVRAQKKAAGLLPEKKKPNYLSKSNVHKSLKRIETGEIYASMSAADRAMGRPQGYVSECFAFSRNMTDRDGNIWTFELLEEGSVILHYKKNPCYIDEIPGKEFANVAEACEAIGRNGTYISDRVSAKKPMTSKDGQLIHFHYSDPEKEAKLQSKYYAVVDLVNVDIKPKQKNLFNISP